MAKVIKYVIPLISIFGLIILSCSTEKLTPTQFNKQIQTYVKDGKVSSEELGRLKQTLLSNKESEVGKLFLTSDELNMAALKPHIQKLSPATELVFEESTDEGSIDPTSGAVTYTIYIENSASMDGYVDGYTGFKNDVFEFLSAIDSPVRKIADSIELNYINSTILPFSSNIEDFVKKLNPNTFMERGGNRSQTDLSKVLDQILETLNKEKVAVLITDGVFSPGKNADAKPYLSNQRIGVKNQLEQALSQDKNLTALVLQMQSNFKGTYYDKENNKIELEDKRPYYIWVLGNAIHVERLLKELNVEKFSEYQHQHIFYVRKIPTDYRISTEKRIGSFTFDRESPLNSIKEASEGTRDKERGKFRFVVAINLKPFGLDASYVSNPDNYRLSDSNYSLSIEAISREDIRKNTGLAAYSHFLILETERLVTEQLEIELLKGIPTWVATSTSSDDSVQEGDELNKTFGFSYMVQGFDEAYQAASEDNEAYFNIKINIEK